MEKSAHRFVEDRNVPWEDMGKGLKRKILAYNRNVMMACVSFEKGAVGAVHSHPHTQVTYVRQGSFEVVIGSEKSTVHSGDSFVVPSGVKHGVVALEGGCLIDVFSPMREDFIAGRNQRG